MLIIDQIEQDSSMERKLSSTVKERGQKSPKHMNKLKVFLLI